jgi:flagellar motility protein MotE (MotC chaperone)
VIQDANAQDMTKLVELYRNMKPQVAAGIMDEIDAETAVQVISAMPERDAAQIMGAVSLVRARLITKIILERSKLPADRNLEGLRLR